MFEFLIFAGIGCVMSSTLKMVQILSTHDIIPKRKEEPILLIAEKSSVSTTMDIKNTNTDNFELERKYAEMILKNSVLRERIKQREEEDQMIKDKVKNTFKKDGKYSKLAEEILNDER